MTSAILPAIIVLDACDSARKLMLKSDDIAGLSFFNKHPELGQPFTRLGMIEDLARFVSFHEGLTKEGDDRVMVVSAEDFALFARHVKVEGDINGARRKELEENNRKVV